MSQAQIARVPLRPILVPAPSRAAQLVASPGERIEWKRYAYPALVSAVCHAALLLLLGLLVAAAEHASAVVELMAAIAEAPDNAPIERVAVQSGSVELTVDSTSAAIGPERIFDRATISPIDVVPDLSALSALATGHASHGLGETGEHVGLVGQGKSQFYGIRGTGQSFVYVVDCSGSMSESDKFYRATRELLRSIESLSYDQRFFVIFFSDYATAMDAEGLVRATPDKVAAARKWVDDMHPAGKTEPLDALLMALRLEPDAVYFLSDGKFDPSVVKAIRDANGAGSWRTPIHTIAFTSREGESLMRAIARNSGGRFRFVK